MGKKAIAPVILYEGAHKEKDLTDLKKNYSIWKTVDIYESQLKEYFEITHPDLIGQSTYQAQLTQFLKARQMSASGGNWVYFPWNGHLIHCVNEKEYYLLRTNRNKNLITIDEQTKLNTSCIAFAGLSVGSGIATTLCYQGIGQTMKLAEFDTLETTNLNRMRGTLKDIGRSKLSIVSDQLYEINPYLHLIPYPDGLTKDTLNSFVHQKPKPAVIFEIIDDFEMKIRLRMEARIAKIPVIMMANLGDSILIDIERYDENSKLPMFNGVIGNLPEKILDNPNEDKHKYAVAIVGKENVPPRAIESVMQIGKTLVGRPQLGSTVTTAAGIASYLTRMIILNQNLPSGRYRVVFSDLFDIKGL